MFSWMTLSPPLSAPARFALIMDGLKRAVAEKIADYPWTGPMVVYVWNRLHRINAIFQALAALIAAGNLPPERVCRPRAVRVLSAVPARPATQKMFAYRFAWLVAAMPSLARRFGAAQFGGHLRHLLADPEMMALVAASPRMRRTLRPLLWMLGMEASLIWPPPSPAVVETVGADVAQDATDEAFVRPSYPPGDEEGAEVQDGEARDPEFLARA
jgi:hypothetical protein